MITVVDYGMGNLKSVANAFEAVGEKIRITQDPADLKAASAVILSGVGAFGEGMRRLREAGLVEALHETVLKERKPYLGICLGMQFLARTGFEHGTHAGFGWLEGQVVRLRPKDPRCRVPHIGWNEVEVREGCPLFTDLEDGPVFYFVHSYHLVPEGGDDKFVAGTCRHGQPVTAAVQKGHIFGVQFHPEKSQRSGLRVLRNFVRFVQEGPQDAQAPAHSRLAH